MRDARARRHLQSFPSFEPFDPADCNQAIHRRFEQQVARRPDAIAIRNSGRDVSYSELNDDANRRARRLLALLDPDTSGRPIALLLPQGYDSIAWTLAILKTGCCYAPLDQRLPSAILRAMIDNLQPVALVVDGDPGLDRSLLDGSFRLVDSADRSEDHHLPSTNLDRLIEADVIACIFCTSGSTGTPKAVADSHRNVLHNVYRYTNTLRFAPDDRLSLVQNPSFSGTVSTLFGALSNGASVVPFDLQGDGLSSLSAGVRQARVTIFHAVPSIFRELTDVSGLFPDIRLIRLEGDRATARDARHFRSNFQEACTLVNGLGATECGLARQFFVDHATETDPGDPVPIGYPVPDVTVRIVDSGGCELPSGKAGEIVVESRFLATGYWRNPSLTEQRFDAADEGKRRYRTGDFGRIDGDGCLVHLGRVDHRVRIAGEFIETADIERRLQAIPGVAEAVVHEFVERSGDQRLCAYIVRAAGFSVTAERLRDALSESVGRSAMPSAFMFLEALPLTRDLKVDRASLPAPRGERPEMPNEYAAPATALEEKLAKVWSGVLGIDVVGATDSLLALGGDSLRAAQIVNALRPIFGDRIRITTLFEHPTIRALARALQGGEAVAPPAAVVPAPPGHSIAVIGMACRFPGAESIDDYWNNLRAGRETITRIRPEETAATSRAEHDSSRVMARGLLAEVDGFDAPLFRLTPLQAQMLDPQQRVWLECVYRAMEDAGLPVGVGGEPHAATIGVFTGGRDSSYLLHLVGGDRARVEALLDGSAADGLELLSSNDQDSIATRTGFLFGFTGPCITVQTACSTSLVAVAQACDAVVKDQCDVAIAGGVAVSFPQNRGHHHQEGGIYSRDGHCRPFDAEASGTVFSDGAGAVVLKRLERAIADGDRIDAVIRGWAVNNDGSDKASFTAPSVEGQIRVIRRAQEHAGVQPHEISYVEAHGTATPVGDPIEFAALERAFGRRTQEQGRCGIGSVKSNIGHTDTAAGIAGLIKTILALKHRELPATLHYRTPNPEISLAESPFYVVDHLRPWNPGGSTRVAGVTSLGVGGTNCHVIVEEAPAAADAAPLEGGAYLVPLSAASADALAALEARFHDYLSSGSQFTLASIAATTQRNRAHHAHRIAIRCATQDQLRGALEHSGLASGSSTAQSGSMTRRWQQQASRVTPPHIGFLFSGGGSEYARMGVGIFQACAEFRRILQRCEDLLRGELERPLLDILFGETDEVWTRRADLAQPALFALEYALAELLRSWGIHPRVVIGHGIGEYAGACFAGVFNLEEGLRLAAARGRAMQDSPLAKLETVVATIALRPSATALISTRSGKLVTHEVTDPRYWSGHARQSVQGAAGIETLVDNGCEMLLQIGPAREPSSLVTGTFRLPLETVATLKRGERDWDVMLETVARLYVAGARLDWTALQGEHRMRPVRLPTHPFKRTRLWYEGSSATAVQSSGDDTRHPLLGRRLRLPGSDEIRFEARFSRQAPQFLEDHQLFGVSLPPAASHLSMLAQAAATLSRTGSPRAFQFTGLNLVRPLLLPAGTQRDVQLIFRSAQGGWDLELVSADSRQSGESAGWTTHLIGQVSDPPVADRPVAAKHWDLDAIRAHCSHRVAGTDFYSRIWANQGGTGSSFRWIDSIWHGDREALCRAVRPAAIVDQAAYELHPGIIEAACQVLHCCGEIETVEQIERGGITYIPFSIDAFRLHGVRPTHGESWCHARLHELTSHNVVADLTILTSSGQVVASLDGFCLRPITREAVVRVGLPAARPEREQRSDRRPVADATATRGMPDVATMTRYLRQQCAEILGGSDDVPTDAGFAALGVDSLAAMRLANHLARDFGCKVSLRQILTCNGIAALAASIVNDRDGSSSAR